MTYKSLQSSLQLCETEPYQSGTLRLCWRQHANMEMMRWWRGYHLHNLLVCDLCVRMSNIWSGLMVVLAEEKQLLTPEEKPGIQQCFQDSASGNLKHSYRFLCRPIQIDADVIYCQMKWSQGVIFWWQWMSVCSKFPGSLTYRFFSLD